MSAAGEFFHRVVELLPFRQESDRTEMHETVDTEIAPLFGRNTTEPGVQKPAESEQSTPDLSGTKALFSDDKSKSAPEKPKGSESK